MIKIVPSARINSIQLIFCNALGITRKAPKTPEADFAAKVCDSSKICESVMASPLETVSEKSSKTRRPSPASSSKIFPKIMASAWGLKVSTYAVSSLA